MRSIVAIALAALALAGCDRHEVNEVNASVGDVANAVAESNIEARLKPGRWQASATLIDLDAPNLPPQAKAMMKKQMESAASSVSICLKPEDINKPGAQFFGQDNPNCRFDHYKMGGGKIDAKMRCAAPSGGSSEMTMNGLYNPTHYEMEVASTATHQGPAPMTMRMKMVSDWVGECTGDEMQGAPTKS